MNCNGRRETTIRVKNQSGIFVIFGARMDVTVNCMLNTKAIKINNLPMLYKIRNWKDPVKSVTSLCVNPTKNKLKTILITKQSTIRDEIYGLLITASRFENLGFI
jgi:hypothetical protein